MIHTKACVPPDPVRLRLLNYCKGSQSRVNAFWLGAGAVVHTIFCARLAVPFDVLASVDFKFIAVFW
jgi:hypothetical protein